MKNIIIITIMSVFASTAAMAHHPFYGNNGGVREVVSVYTQKTYSKTFKVVEVKTTKDGSVKTKKFYWHVEEGKWWNANGSKFKAWLSSHI